MDRGLKQTFLCQRLKQKLESRVVVADKKHFCLLVFISQMKGSRKTPPFWFSTQSQRGKEKNEKYSPMEKYVLYVGSGSSTK